MTIHYFDERLTFSKGRRQESDEATLAVLFPKSVEVVKTGTTEDRAGVDYVVTLRRGARLLVDAKARDQGCGRFWRQGPEVALETWSVLAGGKYSTPSDRAKVGWTLDESKDVDLILFTFHTDDHELAYVRPLPMLREAFRRNHKNWMQRFKIDTQDSGRWQSQCVFVPLTVVDQAIESASKTQRILPKEEVAGPDPALMMCNPCGEPPGWCKCDDANDQWCPRCPSRVSWRQGTVDLTLMDSE